MQPIMLKEITRVYRFGILAQSWERKNAAQDHFIAYKLHGVTLHETGGQSLPFARDMVMVANSEDLYRVTRHDPNSEGNRGGCIAIHFTTMEPFPLHMAIYDCASQPQMKSEFFRVLDVWNQSRINRRIVLFAGRRDNSQRTCCSKWHTLSAGANSFMGRKEENKRRL